MMLFNGVTSACSRLIVCFVICLSHQISIADTVTIWGEYHPPLNGGKEDKNQGFMIDIATSIFEQHGHKVEYVLGPRERGVDMVKNNRIDCVVNAKIKDHHFLSFPQQPWGYHAATLFSIPESTFQYRNMKQVRTSTLGAISGMRYDNGPMDEYLKQRSSNVSFTYGQNAMEKQVKMLVQNRTDIIVSCPLLMRGQLQSMGLPKETLKIVGEIKPFVGMYLACSRGRIRTEGFINLIDKTLPLMRQSGELQRILDKYGQIDWIGIHQSLNTPH